MLDGLIKTLGTVFTSGSVAAEVLVLILFVVCFLLMIFGLVKLLIELKKIFGNTQDMVSKQDVRELTDKLNTILSDIKSRSEDINENVDKTHIAIQKLIEDYGTDNLNETKIVNANVMSLLKTVQENMINIQNVQKDVHEISNDINRLRDLHIGDAHIIAPIKANIDNLTMQINGIQRDLAALHGTIIGLTTQRNGLK